VGGPDAYFASVNQDDEERDDGVHDAASLKNGARVLVREVSEPLMYSPK
jgi:hypothetical protein